MIDRWYVEKGRWMIGDACFDLIGGAREGRRQQLNPYTTPHTTSNQSTSEAVEAGRRAQHWGVILGTLGRQVRSHEHSSTILRVLNKSPEGMQSYVQF